MYILIFLFQISWRDSCPVLCLGLKSTTAAYGNPKYPSIVKREHRGKMERESNFTYLVKHGFEVVCA